MRATHNVSEGFPLFTHKLIYCSIHTVQSVNLHSLSQARWGEGQLNLTLTISRHTRHDQKNRGRSGCIKREMLLLPQQNQKMK